MNDKNFNEENTINNMKKDRFPVLIMLFSVLGMLAVIASAINSLKDFGIMTYFSYFMNLLLYYSILSFAVKGYKDTQNYEKKPYQGLLFKFCMMQLIAIISLRMGNIWYVVLSAVALLLAIKIYKDISKSNPNDIMYILVLVLVFAATVVRIVSPMGDTEVIAEILQYNSIIETVEMHIPTSSFDKLVYVFTNCSQLLQWLLLSGVYFLRFNQYIKPEFKDMNDRM